jgi:hypothetical protein
MINRFGAEVTSDIHTFNPQSRADLLEAYCESCLHDAISVVSNGDGLQWGGARMDGQIGEAHYRLIEAGLMRYEIGNHDSTMAGNRMWHFGAGLGVDPAKGTRGETLKMGGSGRYWLILHNHQADPLWRDTERELRQRFQQEILEAAYEHPWIGPLAHRPLRALEHLLVPKGSKVPDAQAVDYARMRVLWYREAHGIDVKGALVAHTHRLGIWPDDPVVINTGSWCPSEGMYSYRIPGHEVRTMVWPGDVRAGVFSLNREALFLWTEKGAEAVWEVPA